MSAYLCDQDTINAIATFAADHKLVEDPKLFADLLTLQNVASMQARYPGRDWLKAEVLDVAAAYVYEPVPADAAWVADYAAEYDYQACETDDYDVTLCKRLVDRVAVLATAIAELERKAGCGAACNPIEDVSEHVEDYTVSEREEIRATMAHARLNAAHAAGAAYWHHHRMLPGVDRIPVANLAGVARSCGWHGADCEAWLTGFDDGRRDALLAERDELWRRK